MAQLREMDGELAALRRGSGKPSVRLAGLPAPEPVSLPEPEAADPPPPDLRPDLWRAEKEVRGDFALRREAAAPPPAPPVPEPPVPQPAPEPEARSASGPAPEQSTGLEEQISRLNRQLERLKERPEDRLLYTPAQLRRRRELTEITRLELRRLHREQVERLRAALQPPPKPSPRAARRRPHPAPVSEPRRPDPAALDAEEQRALAALRATPDLPAPSAPVPEVTAGASPEARESVTAALKNIPPGRGPAAVNISGYAAALAKRREELRRLMLAELRSAAETACRKRGWRLTLSGPARDATAELRRDVAAILTRRADEVR